MTVDAKADIDALAERFFAAIQAADIEGVRSCYHPAAVIWRNFDRVEHDRDQNLAGLEFITTHWSDFRFDERRRHLLPHGFVQQHLIRGNGPDGTPFECPSIVVVTVEDHLITQVEEYFAKEQTPLGA